MLDSDGQSGLAIVRSLGRHGVDVTAGTDAPPSLGTRTRYSTRTYEHPDPEPDAERFLAHLESYLARTDHDVVIPAVDATTALLARAKPRLEATGTLVGTADPERFDAVFDKARLFRTLVDAGVPTPETYAPESLADMDDVAERVDYPAVVKPRSKTIWFEGRHTRHRVTDANYVAGPAELRSTYRALVASHESLAASLPLVQEFVPGETVCANVLADGGDVVASFQERRVRTHPASGGNSALLAALADDSLRTLGETVIDAIDWTGPAMVECMRRPDGSDVVIEVNGRYWGSLPFAIRSGVDVPWLHYQQLLGESVVGPSSYRTDLLLRRLLFEDCKWLCEQLSRGQYGALWPFLRDTVRADHTFVDFDDPLPTVAALARLPKLVGSLALERVRSR